MAERWRQHVLRARKNTKHPLYAAIRCYGADSFKVETLESSTDLTTALQAEKNWIAKTPDRYNVSEGGELDFLSGVREIKRLLAEDPAWAEEYRTRLSEGCKASSAHNARLPDITSAAAAWREANPKEAWKVRHRATRTARKKTLGVPTGRSTHGPAAGEKIGAKVRAFWANAPASVRRRKSRTSREAATQQWAARSTEERAAVAQKIAAALREANAHLDDATKAERAAQLAQARGRIDRSVQGAAASEGLKRYWVELKKDPEKFAAAMAARMATRKQK